MTIDELIRGIAQDVADLELGYEHSTFPEDQIRRLINEARCVVFGLTPEKYAQVVTVTLQSCKSLQQSGCDNVIKVLGQVDANGCHVANIVEKSTPKYRITWNKASNCSSSNDYTVGQAWTIDGLNGGFMIDPVPPEGVTAYVNVLCASSPDELDENSDIPCEEQAWITHYVIFRLLSVDTESTGHKSVADTYYKSFLQLIGLVEKADKEFKLSSSHNSGVQKK